MTRKVHIEDIQDSDNTGIYLVVETWNKGKNGEPDVMLHEDVMYGLTDVRNFYVDSTRYLVVKERISVDIKKY